MSTQVVEVSDGSIVVTTDVGLNGATKQSVVDEATARADADIALTAALALKAPLASPALTGTPTAPTAATTTSTTQLATTAFVQQELAAGGSTARALVVSVRNQSGGTMAAGTVVYLNGATGNLPTIAKALATSDATSAQTIGLVQTSIADNGTGLVVVRGVLGNLNTSTLTEGQQLYLSPTTAGAYTTTKQYAPNHLVYIGVVTRAHPTLGSIEVAVQNGFELDELHNVSAQSPTHGDTLRYNSDTALWENKALGTVAGLNAGSSAGNVPVLDANGDLVGPIIGRMILFSDTTTVPSLGEQFTAVDSLTAPTQAQIRLGDGITAGGLIASNTEIVITATQTITAVQGARYIVFGLGIDVTFNDIVSPISFWSRYTVVLVHGQARIGNQIYAQGFNNYGGGNEEIRRAYGTSLWLTRIVPSGYINRRSDGINLGGSGAVGSGIQFPFASPLINIAGGNGGNNSVSGTGIGGNASLQISPVLLSITAGSGGAANGNFNGGNGSAALPQAIAPFRICEIALGSGGSAGAGGNGGNAASNPMSFSNLLRLGGGSGGTGGSAGGSGGTGGRVLGSNCSAILFNAGSGGNGGTSGSGGAGGNLATRAASGVLWAMGGQGGASSGTGTGGAGGSVTYGDQEFALIELLSGRGGSAADANGGAGGNSGSLSLNGGAGSDAVAATAGAEGGTSGSLSLSGADASGSTAGGNGGTINLSGQVGLNAPSITSGLGTPEGVVTAPVASLFLRMDGGAGTCMYVKESGTGNTGWVAK